MTTDEVKKVIHERLEKHYGLSIEPGDTLRTAGLDSLDVIELAIELEKEFNITISDQSVENFIDQTVDQIVTEIQPLIR